MKDIPHFLFQWS